MDWLRKFFNRKPEPEAPEEGFNTALTVQEFWDMHPEAKPRVTPGLDVRHDLYLPASESTGSITGGKRNGLACDITAGQWMRYLKQGTGPWFSWRWLTRNPEDAGYRDTAPDVRSVAPTDSVAFNQDVTDFAPTKPWSDRHGYNSGYLAI